MHIDQQLSRRAFLTRGAQLALAGTAAPFVGSLGWIGEAAAATATDYKALVCVFLYGGNDYANTLPPYDAAGHALYQRYRPTLALGRDALAATALRPDQALPDGREYALAPALSPLLPLFDGGKMAIVLNVGTLEQPLTKAQYVARSAPIPPKLFSHNDQQSFFQASNPEGAETGWGGRIGDMVYAGNGAAALTCINASGNAVYVSGRQAIPYTIGGAGPVSLLRESRTLYGSATAAQTLRQLMTEGGQTLFADDYSATVRRALDTYGRVNGALAGAPADNFPLFPAGETLADQLKLVARLISASADLGVKRQVFFVSLGGWDHHDSLLTKHPAQLARVAAAMRAFYDTTMSLGVADKVTTFTASDFGRTLSSNGDGSDHGWGAMHWVMGGAVKGRRFYGRAPQIGSNTSDDVGAGRLLPSTSVDQYAATLASWFGVADGDLTTVLPNLGNWDRSGWNLGFV
ncbi:DUF1501 domain-containing protein [Sphingomonas lenta]|uniref:Tat pathway signal protein n=1 Tax=Sphingomonas lenta TaxID=1141887 RepID=A0A2A2SAV0_9SPHN|nr:DUF1501 domain-containing protein [Sphingomonas lenta]PAX06325.1 Tat pathway signal protein [Sphingomonas lenta]